MATMRERRTLLRWQEPCRQPIQRGRPGVIIDQWSSVGKTAISLRAERVVQGKVNQSRVRLMIIVVVMRGIIDFHLLALKLALNSLAIWSITNERQNRPYALNKLCGCVRRMFNAVNKNTYQHALARFCVVKSSLRRELKTCDMA